MGRQLESLCIRRMGPVTYQIEELQAPASMKPVRVLADEALFARIAEDRSLEQLLNVRTLPGVSGFVVGMPDMHEGYGFPVGGVAAMALPEGVISPGGIGFDINCGVRLLASSLRTDELKMRPRELLHELARSIPTGYGRAGRMVLTSSQLELILAHGCEHLVRKMGKGVEEDLEKTESKGCLPDANPSQVSWRAKQRGAAQLGTLGGGNHFLEIQEVETVYHSEAAKVLGLFEGQLTIMIHTGSRGLGHQVCSDYLKAIDEAKDAIAVPDRQLACVPFHSALGQSYFQAMSAAGNFAFCNRQLLTESVRSVFQRSVKALGRVSLRLVYDVAHNTAKVEDIGGRLYCVHRKGATRALGPLHPDLPAVYQAIGQPVFIPGSMGTASYVLVGKRESTAVSWASCCHGAGRRLSRGAAKRSISGSALRDDLEKRGISIECPSNAELAEEAPEAYKDIDRVVQVVETAQIAQKVARLRPIGVLKG